MRGCVSAGMVAAIHCLGLADAFDVVYGSSAGTVISAYFITRQLPYFGPEIYYDSLTTAGREFIDTRRLLRAVGLGLVDPRLYRDVLGRRDNGKPVLNLDYLLVTTAQNRKLLDWDKFVEMQKVQPLKVVASGLKSGRSLLLDMENGSFNTLEELAECMHASCLLPGIAGPVMNMNTREIVDERRKRVNGGGDDDGGSKGGEKKRKFQVKNNLNDEDLEPLADALIYEPMAYRSAAAEGATHVLLLRTRPDGVDVTGKSGVFESMILKRFFLKKNKLRNTYDRLSKHLHKKQYAADIIELNAAAADFEDDRSDGGTTATATGAIPPVMPIALPPGSPEVTRLETGREAIFEGVRRGFARAYDALVEDVEERGRGHIVAKEYFPDEILDYDPLEYESPTESAYDNYLKKRREE